MAGEQFYNTSPLTFTKLLDDPEHDRRLAAPLHRRLLGGGQGRDRQVRLRHPDRPAEQGEPALPGRSASSPTSTCTPRSVSNIEMGYLYEELIRRFSELSNETAGEHFTPREVIRLMVNLLFIDDERRADQAGHRQDALRPGLRHRRHAVGRRGSPARAQPAGTAGGLRPGAERRDLRDLPLGHDAQGPGRLPHRLRQLASPRTATRASSSTTCSPTRRSVSSGRRSRPRSARRRRARASTVASALGCRGSTTARSCSCST